jgi:hypothetical protein
MVDQASGRDLVSALRLSEAKKSLLPSTPAPTLQIHRKAIFKLWIALLRDAKLARRRRNFGSEIFV